MDNKNEKIENPSKEIKDAWHKNSTNWILGIFYYNKKDPRTFVNKRSWQGIGFTLNFARSSGIFWSALIIGLVFLIIKYRIGF